jgi:hypothetical protein
MAQVVHERVVALLDRGGRRYDLARTLAEEQADGSWHGSIEFRSAEGHVLRTARETTQVSREAVGYWAEGLETVFLEGALRRAEDAA